MRPKGRNGIINRRFVNPQMGKLQSAQITITIMKKLISKIEKAVLVFSAFGLFSCILWNAVNVILNFGESSFTQIFDAFLLTGILLLFQALIFAMLWANKNQ